MEGSQTHGKKGKDKFGGEDREGPFSWEKEGSQKSHGPHPAGKGRRSNNEKKGAAVDAESLLKWDFLVTEGPCGPERSWRASWKNANRVEDV